RSEAIDEEVTYWLKKSGFYYMAYAAENGSDRMLKLIDKKVSLDKMFKSIKAVKKHKIHTAVNIIFGLPDEKHIDVWKSLGFLFKCRRYGVNDMNLFFFRPYPGSKLFNRLIKENKLQVNDDYIVDSIFIIDIVTENIYYNDNISPFWYK